MQRGKQVKGLAFAQLKIGGKKQTGKAASGTYMLTAHRRANILQITTQWERKIHKAALKCTGRISLSPAWKKNNNHLQIFLYKIEQNKIKSQREQEEQMSSSFPTAPPLEALAANNTTSNCCQ